MTRPGLKILTVKKSAEFQRINKKGQKFFSHTIILLTSPSPSNIGRVGYTVAKTVSKLAVQRNLAKRRLREAFRALAPQHARKNFDYVLIARKEILAADFSKIFNDLKFCITRIHSPKNAQGRS
ncbi:MAG: ribonuclease P protein component [Alphaproteobacteria bacterium]|nr:ribonuclease P protein component [Alphaproteobacteria bacterium]